MGRADEVIGRTAELDLIEGLVADVASGRGRSLLVEGEPGIGKSALLAAGLARASAAGCEVLRGQCDELGQRFPLSVMARLLQVEAGADDPRRAQAALALEQPETAVGWNTRIAYGDPVAAAVEQLLVLVDELCSTGPIVLAVDDLHWADEASLLLWRRLCRATAQLPLLVIGTCRPTPRQEELEQLRREVRTQRGDLIPLDRLTEESVARLVGRLAGGEPGPRLVKRVEAAAGNPLYVRELLDALARAGALRTEDGMVELAVDDQRPGVGGSLAGAIADRLDFLSAETREVLRTAALLGSEFSVAELAAVAGRGQGSLLGLVEEALTAGVLESAGARLRFRHGLLNEALYEATPTALRGALRQHAAKALIRAGAPVERIAELIQSALEKADGWELDWLAENAGQLADRAPAVAAELLEHGLRHTSPEDPRYAVMEDRLAVVSHLLTDYDRTEQLAQGILRHTADPDRVGGARFLLAKIAVLAGRYEEALANVGSATADVRIAPVWQARLGALQALALCFLGRSEAAGAATRALVEGERLGDLTATGYALHASSVLSSREGDQTESITLIDRALALIGGDPRHVELRLTLLGNRMAVLDSLGRFQEAAEIMALARSLAERIGAPRLSTLLIQDAERCFEHGRWDDAVAELGEVTGTPHPHHQLLKHGIAALVSGRRDEWQHAAGHLDVFKGRAIPPGWPSAAAYLLMARSLAAERAGRLQEAVEVLAVLLTPEYEQQMETRCYWLPALVRVALTADDRQIAQQAALSCQQEAEREPLPPKNAAADWCRGLLHADPAPVLAAADYYRDADRRPDLGNALEDAALLQAMNGDFGTARETLTEALAVYADLGAAWDARHATTRLRAYGVRVETQQRPSSGWEALTATELRVAEFVAQGLSNPEIADRLLLSRRTVETHVSHILTKLQVSSRREVTGLAEAGH